MKGEKGFPGIAVNGPKGDQGDPGNQGPPGPPCDSSPNYLESGNQTETGPKGDKGDRGFPVRVTSQCCHSQGNSETLL